MQTSFIDSLHDKTIPIRIAAIALSLAFGTVGTACSMHYSANDQKISGTTHSVRRMADGKQWMAENLNVQTDGSYCYDDAELNCRRYGRLYTWKAAQQACQSRGGGWRLPTDDEWRDLAKHHGGVHVDTNNTGKAAYAALLMGGRSGFNALLGGGRVPEEGRYSRLEAHGFYWTATETSPANALFYNFGKGSSSLYRQPEGNKQMAISVRCVRE